MVEVKESVRQGVGQVAGRLSGMMSGVMITGKSLEEIWIIIHLSIFFQEKYGYFKFTEERNVETFLFVLSGLFVLSRD